VVKGGTEAAPNGSLSKPTTLTCSGTASALVSNSVL